MLVARLPLQILSMSEMQAGSRRVSARLQGKDESHHHSTDALLGGMTSKVSSKSQASSSGARKRKNDYEEEDDGFSFSRVKKNKRTQEITDETNEPTAPAVVVAKSRPAESAKITTKEMGKQHEKSSNNETEPTDQPKKKRKKMSFSTPKAKESQPVRRSKRLSNEATQQNRSPVPAPTANEIKLKKRRKTQEVNQEPEKIINQKTAEGAKDKLPENVEATDTSILEHSATKIALPFADTPVIRRNKAMREGKSTKGDRRSSLGLRGRRASSLIETGNSNALPHQEVDPVDFYKHIESDLMEPRRMRQLLTWCATRAMHAKPKGTDFEDASAKSAARVIEEELLKELSSKSELSNWFTRDDVPEPPKPLPEKANPKNVQNIQKIAELEAQINMLKIEREALQNLLKPPEMAARPATNHEQSKIGLIDPSLLSEEDAAILKALQTSSQLPGDVLRRVNAISSSLGPSIDQFADGVHKIAQYRTATDNIAGKVLSLCANKLDDRERAGKRRALDMQEDRSPGRDLSNVLRGISKADR